MSTYRISRARFAELRATTKEISGKDFLRGVHVGFPKGRNGVHRPSRDCPFLYTAIKVGHDQWLLTGDYTF